MRSLTLLLLLPLSLFASEPNLRRIQAHLLIGDAAEAVKEAQAALALNPDDPKVYELALKSFSSAGDEGKMLAVWEAFHTRFPEKALEQEVLEQMCWGILRKGERAPGVTSQLISMIGAALAQDMYAVPFLLNGLRHTNAHIRSVAVQLAALYGDYPLREEIARMFHTETALDVRLDVIRAVSKLRLDHLMPELMERINDPKIGALEKRATLEAIVNFRETVTHEELEVFAASSRAALRELACEAIIHCQLSNETDLLYMLVGDTHPDVQAAALKGLGILRAEPTEQIKQLALEANDPLVGISAAWVWLLSEPESGEKAFGCWLNHRNKEIQAIAASAVTAAGPYGVDLAKTYLDRAKDPYVKVNLALALIGQRVESERACAILDRFMRNTKEKWMFVEEGVFQTLLKSTVTHKPAIPNFPEVVNQTVRLELLNLLAILEYPGAEEAIKAFLKQRQWGVTGLAAETLLGEGDETAIDHVRDLLDDPDPQIQAEAALVLASWGRDPTAVPYLLKAYHKGDRQLKIKILETLGRIGDRETIPFLIERLKEPSLILRVIAASILIQTLNS